MESSGVRQLDRNVGKVYQVHYSLYFLANSEYFMENLYTKNAQMDNQGNYETLQ